MVSCYDGEKRVASNFLVIPYNIPEQNIASYFPEANVLIPYNKYVDKSHTLISKSIGVTIGKAK